MAKNKHATKEKVLENAYKECQFVKIGHKVVQKLSLEKKFLIKEWSPKLIFSDEICF